MSVEPRFHTRKPTILRHSFRWRAVCERMGYNNSDSNKLLLCVL
jgi:hypothetical protein